MTQNGCKIFFEKSGPVMSAGKLKRTYLTKICRPRGSAVAGCPKKGVQRCYLVGSTRLDLKAITTILFLKIHPTRSTLDKLAEDKMAG